jgi:hypothetical protein
VQKGRREVFTMTLTWKDLRDLGVDPTGIHRAVATTAPAK